MTTYQEKDVTCSNCGARTHQHILGSTNEFGSPDLDLRPPPMMRSTMRSWLQECSVCGFVAPRLDEETLDLRNLVASADYQNALKAGATPPPAGRFLARAMIAAARNEPLSAFLQVLYAAWVADDAQLTELARSYRLRALEYWCGTPEASPEQNLRLLDVLRRAGRWEAGDALVARLVNADISGNLAKILAFQAALLSRHDESCYKVSDVIFPTPPRPGRAAEAARPKAGLFSRLGHWISRQ
jgi:hypothetical protein